MSNYIKLRERYGEFHLFETSKEEKLFNYFRMKNKCYELDSLIEDDIVKENTNKIHA